MSDMSIYSGNSLNPKEYKLPFKSTNKETSLVLHGPDSYNFGQDMLTSLVHLLENFANSEPPNNPIIGQTYYNTTTKKLNVRTSTGWSEVNLVPNTDPLNVVYLDNSHDSTYKGEVFADLLTPYVTFAGNLKPAVITTSYFSDNPHQAVTKDYVDTTLVPENFNYVPIDGGSVTMTGPLKLKPTTSADTANTAVTVGYVNGLGTLSASVDVSDSNFIVTKYSVSGQTDEKGNQVLPAQYTVVNFNTVLLNNIATVKVSLPAGVVFTGDEGTMVVNCNTVGVSTKLHVQLQDGANFTVTRESSEGDFHVQGTVSGFTA